MEPRAAISDEAGTRILVRILSSVADADPDCARRLIAHFGSFGAVLHASGHTIERMMGPAIREAVAATQAAIAYSLRERLFSSPISAPDKALIRYLVGTMGDCPREQMRVFYLDSGNHLLRDEVAVMGAPNLTVIAPRVIIGRALELEATALLLAHNHPGGDCRPSDADIRFSRRFAQIAGGLGIALHDHLIIAGEQWTSMRSIGALA